MERRNFFKTLGIVGAAAVAGGCKEKNSHFVEDISMGEISPDLMSYRIDPKWGDRVSLLGFGCMRIPRYKVKGETTQFKYDQEAFNAMVDFAIDHGVNYFDTSPRYCEGLSEEMTGKALERHDRSKYFIATKMSNMGNPEFQRRDKSIEMYHHSMKALRTDYFDYYLLHQLGTSTEVCPTADDEFRSRFIDNGILDFLLEEREAGRIRHLGWSFHGDMHFFDKMLESEIPWDFVQIQLNYLDWKHASGYNVNAEYLYGELEKRDIPVVVMEPIRGGNLARVNYKVRSLLKQREPEKSTASWAFRFAGQFPKVLTVLSGMTYMQHLRDNLITFSPLEPLNEDDLCLLDYSAGLLLEMETQGTPCTDCKYCMPCPYGLDIPGIFLHYNRCLTEGQYPENIHDEQYRKARRAFLVGYDRSVPKLRQADHCTGCGQCVAECPQRINIPEEMKKIDAFVESLRTEGGY